MDGLMVDRRYVLTYHRSLDFTYLCQHQVVRNNCFACTIIPYIQAIDFHNHSYYGKVGRECVVLTMRPNADLHLFGKNV